MSDVFDDFGSRGDMLGLPQLSHEPDRPMEVKDRDLATVIIESFDSLQESFDRMSKGLKPLTKNDVYDATKRAIADSGLKGGSGRGSIIAGGSKDVAPDIKEVHEYWKAKTEREIASEKRIEEQQIKAQQRQIEQESKQRVDSFWKWTQQAMTNPLAFAQDFLYKKTVEPMLMKIAGSKNKEEDKKEEDKDKQEHDKENLEKQGKSPQLIGLRMVLDDEMLNILNLQKEMLHDELTSFGKAFFNTLGAMFGSGFSGAGGVSGDLTSPVIGIEDDSESDINEADDESDAQNALDNVTDVVETPDDTEFGKWLASLINGDEEQENDEDKKTDDEQNSFIDKFKVLIFAALGWIATEATAWTINGIDALIDWLLKGWNTVSDWFSKNIAEPIMEFGRKAESFFQDVGRFFGFKQNVKERDPDTNPFEIIESSKHGLQELEKLYDDMISLEGKVIDYELSTRKSKNGARLTKLKSDEFAQALNELDVTQLFGTTNTGVIMDKALLTSGEIWTDIATGAGTGGIKPLIELLTGKGDIGETKERKQLRERATSYFGSQVLDEAKVSRVNAKGEDISDELIKEILTANSKSDYKRLKELYGLDMATVDDLRKKIATKMSRFTESIRDYGSAGGVSVETDASGNFKVIDTEFSKYDLNTPEKAYAAAHNVMLRDMEQQGVGAMSEEYLKRLYQEKITNVQVFPSDSIDPTVTSTKD